MTKKIFVFLLVALLASQLELRAQDYFSVEIEQDSLIKYCNPDSLTTASINIYDPFNEVDTFLVKYEINKTLQEDSVFYVDSLHWQDTVKVIIWDETQSIQLASDSIIIADEPTPIISMYSESYHKNSLFCDSTGQDKWELSGGYPFTSANIDAGELSGIGGNHLITSEMPPGRRILQYSIYGCSQEPFLFTVESENKPSILTNQLKLASSCGTDAKLEFMISDSSRISYINEVLYDDSIIHVHVNIDENSFIIQHGSCTDYVTLDIKKEENNILTIENVVNPHNYVSTGNVTISSSKEIGDAKYVFEEIENLVSFNQFEVKYNYLTAGNYKFMIKDTRDCWDSIKHTLEMLPGNPIPHGFSVDSVFNFSIDGVAINQVTEIGSQYSLKIWKVYENGPTQEVFNTEKGDKLPWDKTLNGQTLYGYFLYHLFISNDKYKGEKNIKSNFRIFK